MTDDRDRDALDKRRAQQGTAAPRRRLTDSEFAFLIIQRTAAKRVDKLRARIAALPDDAHYERQRRHLEAEIDEQLQYVRREALGVLADLGREGAEAEWPDGIGD